MDWQRFAEQMGVMAQDLREQPSVDATLGRVTGAAVELVEGCEAAGVVVLGGQGPVSLTPSQPLVAELDELQGKLDQGPCLDAARRVTGKQTAGERAFRIADFTQADPRWPDFVTEARKRGMGSMMGFLLPAEQEGFGVLCLYSRLPGAFTEESERSGALLAFHAEVALSAARTHAQMEQALATRHEIGQAMGILMARHRIPENEAFNALRRHSQNHNVKLRDVARLVCEQGALPRP
ncbi:GAF and ANTAR domain-containing protein [Streptomyces rubiginosohelvolus]|uniref:GAF and ANTAR domain-containing protein n=1 Tax=Streptomyces rubiginosohelvolus TaxID=67362 RepID=UPI0036A0FE8A